MAMFVSAHAARGAAASTRAGGDAARRWPRRTWTGRCPATPTCSAPSPSTWPPPARLRLDAPPRPRALRVVVAAAGRAAARRRRARRASTSTPTASWSPRELGFAGVAENSIDAVSNRDFVLDYLAAAATCATHLSRLGAELVLWSSEEFGFCEVSDAWASGSSIMPQKKNPDAAELLRAKAPADRRAPGRAPRRDARPAADLQQGHAGGQGAPVRRGRHARAVPRGRAHGMLGDDHLPRASASRPPPRDEFLAATDIADLLVRRGHAVPRGARRRRRARARGGRAAACRCRS